MVLLSTLPVDVATVWPTCVVVVADVWLDVVVTESAVEVAVEMLLVVLLVVELVTGSLISNQGE